MLFNKLILLVAGHLLRRWRGQGPDVGQSSTALGPPGSVSLFLVPGRPVSKPSAQGTLRTLLLSSLQLEVHSVPPLRAS